MTDFNIGTPLFDIVFAKSTKVRRKLLVPITIRVKNSPENPTTTQAAVVA
jgi:hypothetical protein